jgi:UDPglucose--hexose-1-phosphate uridylyltransferase
MAVNPEIRRDITMDTYVIFAPKRSERPEDFASDDQRPHRRPAHKADCPFCPGNEAMLPGILRETPGDETEAWQCRVVPNKYPALVPHLNGGALEQGIYTKLPGYGRHEVIIESPLHNAEMAEMTPDTLRVVFETYLERFRVHRADERVKSVILFRNHGRRAGASLLHPHAQLIASAIVPHHVRVRRDVAARYHAQHQRCLICDLLAYESEHRQRVLAEDDFFLVIILYAAQVPFETWIIPKRHRADFGRIASHELAPLAVNLRAVLLDFKHELGHPDYNFIIHSAAGHPDRAGEAEHWFLQIRPRLTTPAGFEIGSGIHINPSLPERDARRLRQAGR